jgi:choline kinase
MKTEPNSLPKVVILAAGAGSRIRSLTDDCPKSLLEVAGKPILERMIRNCQSCGLSEFILVVGHLNDRIRSFVAGIFPDLDVTYVVNEKFAETNSGYSLMLAADALGGAGFIKFDADVVFEVQILRRLIRSDFVTVLCFDRATQSGADGVKVVVDDQSRVRHASKEVELKKARGELIGIEKIDADAAALLFGELSQMMFDDTHNQAYYEIAYERLIARGIAFHALDITGLNCSKVVTHDGFVVANKMFRARAKPAAPKHHHLLRASSIKAYKRT